MRRTSWWWLLIALAGCHDTTVHVVTPDDEFVVADSFIDQARDLEVRKTGNNVVITLHGHHRFASTVGHVTILFSNEVARDTFAARLIADPRHDELFVLPGDDWAEVSR